MFLFRCDVCGKEERGRRWPDGYSSPPGWSGVLGSNREDQPSDDRHFCSVECCRIDHERRCPQRPVETTDPRR